MSLKPYPEYRKSYSVLLGDLPSHWEVARLRSALSIKKDLVGNSWSDHLLLSLTLQGVIPRDMENRVGKLPADFTTYQRVERNDLIFCLFDVEETPRTVGWVPQSGMLTGAYTAASASPNFDSKYLTYHYLSYDQRKSLRGYYAGLRNTIRSADFANIPIAFPPLKEQQTIVEYLDRETAEIDAFIADQEELITLLNERRTATINRAVTVGLVHAPMKQSETKWIGVMPQHWSLMTLSRLMPVQESGVSVNGHGEPASAGDLGVLKTGAASKGYFDPNENKKVADEDLSRVACPLRNGWLLVNRANTPELVGSVAFVTDAPTGLYLSDKLWQVDFKEAENKFMYWWMSSTVYKSQLQFHRVGASSTMQNLSYSDFKTLDVAVPPLDEQQEIAAYLDRETTEIDAAIADALEAIALSKERRASLISAAVTGKVDVRDALPPMAIKVEAESVGVA